MVYLVTGIAIMQHSDEEFMRQALAEAELARQEGEVPIGAIVVVGDEPIGKGHNAVIATQDPTAHAEIEALREAPHTLGNSRLSGWTLLCPITSSAMRP